jgi:hypothetical protein
MARLNFGVKPAKAADFRQRTTRGRGGCRPHGVKMVTSSRAANGRHSHLVADPAEQEAARCLAGWPRGSERAATDPVPSRAGLGSQPGRADQQRPHVRPPGQTLIHELAHALLRCERRRPAGAPPAPLIREVRRRAAVARAPRPKRSSRHVRGERSLGPGPAAVAVFGDLWRGHRSLPARRAPPGRASRPGQSRIRA